MWIRCLVEDLQGVDKMGLPMVVKMDNQGRIKQVYTETVNYCTKHTDIRYHFNRESVLDGLVDLEYFPTNEMLPEVLTKTLGCTLLGVQGRLSVSAM